MKLLTNDQRKQVERASYKYPDQADVDAVNSWLKPCPDCGAQMLVVEYSVCQDQSCCGIPNAIHCQNCTFLSERYGFASDLVEEFLK